MKKVFKLFFDATKELEWLRQQKGWMLVYTNGIQYIFVESECDYNYEFVYFQKNVSELAQIKDQIQDSEIEFVCNSLARALFRKEVSKGELHVLEDNYVNYKALQKRFNTYLALGAAYLGLGTTQISLSFRFGGIYILIAILFYISSLLFFLSAYYDRKSAQMYDDGTYAKRLKEDKR